MWQEFWQEDLSTRGSLPDVYATNRHCQHAAWIQLHIQRSSLVSAGIIFGFRNCRRIRDKQKNPQQRDSKHHHAKYKCNAWIDLPIAKAEAEEVACGLAMDSMATSVGGFWLWLWVLCWRCDERARGGNGAVCLPSVPSAWRQTNIRDGQTSAEPHTQKFSCRRRWRWTMAMAMADGIIVVNVVGDSDGRWRNSNSIAVIAGNDYHTSSEEISFRSNHLISTIAIWLIGLSAVGYPVHRCHWVHRWRSKPLLRLSE